MICTKWNLAEACRKLEIQFNRSHHILQCIGGPLKKKPSGPMPWRSPCRLHPAKALATPTQLPISESPGESWILQLMKHDEPWHLHTYKLLQIPMGIMWLGDFRIPFGLHQLLQFWCWPCSVLATLGCRLAAARPGDWLEAIKGLSTLVICVSAACWSVWVSLSSLCNRDYVV